MSQHQIYIIILKVFGLYLATICIDSMIELSTFFLSDSMSDEYFYVVLNSQLSSLSIYLILSFLFLSKTKFILKLVFEEKKIEDETIDSSFLIDTGVISKKSILHGAIKIIGIIILALPIGKIGQIIYTSVISKGIFNDVFFLMGFMTELVSPLIQFFVGYLLIRSPNWLLNFLRVNE